ncbi:Tigger transposable element-derived protein 2 [Blattella germanica]|nr:Tigger transposable element-derived protein 2 [Blattella germanica]
MYITEQLTIQKRLDIIKALDAGDSIKYVARKFEVSSSTVNMIKTNSRYIKKHAKNLQSKGINLEDRKSFRIATDEKLDSALYVWYVQQRSSGIAVSGSQLKKKALEINKELGGNPTFSASSGWLRHFKLRHGIKSLRVQGEILNSDNGAKGRRQEVKPRDSTEEQIPTRVRQCTTGSSSGTY